MSHTQLPLSDKNTSIKTYIRCTLSALPLGAIVMCLQTWLHLLCTWTWVSWFLKLSLAYPPLDLQSWYTYLILYYSRHFVGWSDGECRYALRALYRTLLANAIAPWFSSRTSVAPTCSCPRSFRIERTQRTSRVHKLSAVYFAPEVLSATVCCYLDLNYWPAPNYDHDAWDRPSIIDAATLVCVHKILHYYLSLSMVVHNSDVSRCLEVSQHSNGCF